MNYLHRSTSHIYYLRYRLPPNIGKIIGRVEIKLSLRTKNKKEAKAISRRQVFYIQQLKQLTKMDLTTQTLELISKKLISSMLLEHQLNRPTTGSFASDGEAKHYTGLMASQVEKELASNTYAVTEKIIQEFLVKEGITCSDPRLLKSLANKYCRTSIELFESDLALMDSDVLKSNNLVKAIEDESRASQAIQLPPYEIEPSKDELLTGLIEKFRSEMVQQSSWTTNTENENLKIFEVLIEILPVEHVGLVTKTIARTAKENLFKLPPNRKKVKPYKSLSIAQILSLDITPDKGMNISTVIKYLTRWSSFFNWCLAQGYCDSNPFEGLMIKDKRKQKDKRIPFTPEQLTTIFIQPFFTGTKKPLHAYYYWLPLLGAFHGARISELCGLSTQDIKKIDGIWCMHIVENVFRPRLKNDDSERIIPIHPKLIELGFLDYVSSRPDGMLLDITPAKRAVGDNASKWFGRLKKNLGFNKLTT
ncbi:MAG: site-specific integrase, partial [Gammaproteobacteria bacterium]|nr:site-specific integrase [Gammaproteobacteria bacterium]